MNYLAIAGQAQKVDKIKKELNKETSKLKSDLTRLAKEASKHGYTLWHREDDTYFWENRHKQVANYSTLADAIMAYANETIDF